MQGIWLQTNCSGFTFSNDLIALQDYLIYSMVKYVFEHICSTDKHMCKHMNWGTRCALTSHHWTERRQHPGVCCQHELDITHITYLNPAGTSKSRNTTTQPFITARIYISSNRWFLLNKASVVILVASEKGIACNLTVVLFMMAFLYTCISLKETRSTIILGANFISPSLTLHHQH